MIRQKGGCVSLAPSLRRTGPELPRRNLILFSLFKSTKHLRLPNYQCGQTVDTY